MFILSSFSSLEGAECFNEGVSWTVDYLQGITLNIPTASACLDLCTKTADCVAFTWLDSDFAIQLLPESCLTYSGFGETVTCRECTSGRVADCQLCSQPVGCQIGKNLLDAVPGSSEVECKHMCYHKAGCEYYTWYENSTAFMNICFLLSSCENNVDCTGCTSGSHQCQTEYCKGIEYNLLEDPTRNPTWNEVHGKETFENVIKFISMRQYAPLPFSLINNLLTIFF